MKAIYLTDEELEVIEDGLRTHQSLIIQLNYFSTADRDGVAKAIDDLERSLLECLEHIVEGARDIHWEEMT